MLNKLLEGFGYAAIAASMGQKCRPRAAFLVPDRTPSNSFKHTFDNLDISLIYKNQALLNPYYITN